MNTEATATSLRALGVAPDEHGVRWLSRREYHWVDGEEDRVAAIVSAAADRSSCSDELAAAATSWPERYHLSRSRANVVRALSLPPGSSVLEIGAGCGAISRGLGEAGLQVDALEPTARRAQVARLRTADLANVEVFVGHLDDVPEDARYDLVVVVGVLEYVGRGTSDRQPYLDFLGAIAHRLAEGGALVLAIENQLGVKYLAGAKEDHTGRVFDGIEGYPSPGPARTFSRQALAGLLDEVGLSSTFLHAFPDYKLPRLVFSDALLDGPAASLAWRVPHFPSPEWVDPPRPRYADEASTWRTLVEAGLGAETANSFLVVAGDGRAHLWSDDRLATFFSSERRAAFATRTDVVAVDGAVELARTRLVEGRPTPPTLEHRPVSEPFLDGGVDMVTAIVAGDDRDTERLVHAWRDLVRAQPADGPTAIDLVPRNVLVSGGEVLAIDQEWWADGWGPDEVTARGLLLLAHELGQRCRPQRWPVTTVRELALHLGDLAGWSGGTEWIASAVGREAVVQALVAGVDPESSAWAGAVAEHAQAWRELLAQPLTDGPLGLQEHERRQDAEARAATVPVLAAELDDWRQRAEDQRRATEQGELEVRSLTEELSAERSRHRAVRSDLEAVHVELAETRRELAAVYATRTMRALRVPRKLYRSGRSASRSR